MDVCKKLYRLPEDIEPYHYEITITPDIENLTFKGEVQIFFQVVNPTNTIVLNSAELIIHSCAIKEHVAGNIQVSSFELHPSEEILSIALSGEIQEKRFAYLEISYTGRIRSDLKGLYRSRNLCEDGKESFVGVTLFKPYYARFCFPSWDEPIFKARFRFTLNIPDEFTAVSNMPIKSKKVLNENLQSIIFETAPQMSTYLTAFVIGKFDHIEGRDHTGLIYRVYTPVGKKQQGLEILEIAKQILTRLAEYFGVPYFLPKLDCVAVSDFEPGSAENWGLIICRESKLLWDDKNSSSAQKLRMCSAVAHGLAHQWFGNLVTPKWWAHFWLSGGLATYVENLITDIIWPETETWLRFLGTSLGIFEFDALGNSHAVEVPVDDSWEVLEALNGISSFKGARVIGMLRDYVGDDVLHRVLSAYLNKNYCQNATSDELWKAPEDECRKPIRELMFEWTKRPGFPLVRFKETSREPGNKCRIKITQERFSVREDSTVWRIPLKIQSIQNPEKVLWHEVLESTAREFEVECAEDAILLVNRGSMGFHITLYEGDILENYVGAVTTGAMTPVDRFKFLSDLFASCQAGYVPTSKVLNIFLAYKGENHYVIWELVVRCYKTLGYFVSNRETVHKEYLKFGRFLLGDIHAKLGWDSGEADKQLDRMLRCLVLNTLVTFEDPRVTEEANRRFGEYISKIADLPADLRVPIYRSILISGIPNGFENLMKLYRETDFNEEQERIISALGTIKSPELLKQALKFSLSDEVKSQDTIKLLLSASDSEEGRSIVWEFFQNHLDSICRRCSGYRMEFLLSKILEKFAREEVLSDVETFFRNNPALVADRVARRILEAMRLRITWAERDGESIIKFFEENNFE